MTNILVVTLTPQRKLHVDQSGGHHWIRASRGEPQPIFWVLSGAGLAHARFVMPGRKRKPGFDWPKRRPPSGIFGTPQLLEDGRVLAVPVKHVGKDSEGWWKYVIRVRCCQEEFETEYDDIDPCFEPPPVADCEDGERCGGKRMYMVKNPIIINR